MEKMVSMSQELSSDVGALCIDPTDISQPVESTLEEADILVDEDVLDGSISWCGGDELEDASNSAADIVVVNNVIESRIMPVDDGIGIVWVSNMEVIKRVDKVVFR